MLLIVVMLSLLFLSSAFLTRYTNVAAGYYYASEVAINLAESGIADVLSNLRFERVPNPEHGEGFRQFYDDLLTQLPGGNFRAAYAYIPGPAVRDALTAINQQPYRSRMNADLKINLLVSDWGSMVPPPFASSLSMVDQAEKQGVLRIQSIGACAGVTREMNLIARISVVNVIHPQLAKFSLFIAHPPPFLAANPLMQSESSPAIDRVSNPGGAQGAPVVLDNGGSVNLRASGFAGVSPDPILKNALIYLGGTWRIGLGGCEQGNQSPTSERFLLRMADYDITGLIDQIGMAERPHITKIKQMMYGGKADMLLKDRSGRDQVYPIQSIMAYKFSSRNSDADVANYRGSFAFRLFGDIEHYSPAVIIGDVIRYFFVLNTLDGYFVEGGTTNFSDVPAPFLPDSYLQYMKRPDASPSNLPASMEADAKQLIFDLHMLFNTNDGNELEKLKPFYRTRIMSRVQLENANMAHDYVLSNRETMGGGGPVAAGTEMPVIPGDGDPSPAREGVSNGRHSTLQLSSPVVQWKASDDLRTGKVKLRDGGGGRIFDGKLEEIRGFDELLARVIADFGGEQVFWNKCSKADNAGNGRRDLYVPGVAHLNGNLTIDREVIVKGGGIIICDGNITISAGISATPGEPLTLCAGGKITIATSRPIAAGLIALRPNAGRLTVAGGISSWSLAGPVAVWDVDYVELVKGPGPKTLTWPREQFDDGTIQKQEKYFPRRIFVSDEHRIFFGKGS